MARLIIANTHNQKGIQVSGKLAERIQTKVGDILKQSNNAYVVASGEAPGKIGAVYELPKKGAANVEINYMTGEEVDNFLSSSIELVGTEDLWEAGSKLVKDIKKYFTEEENMKIYRDEIVTPEGRKYVKGAFFSRHMLEHGHSLVEE